MLAATPAVIRRKKEVRSLRAFTGTGTRVQKEAATSGCSRPRPQSSGARKRCAVYVLYCRCKKEVRSLLAFTGTQVQILTRWKALRWYIARLAGPEHRSAGLAVSDERRAAVVLQLRRRPQLAETDAGYFHAASACTHRAALGHAFGGRRLEPLHRHAHAGADVC